MSNHTTDRTEQTQRIVSVNSQSAVVECRSCYTLHRVERDEDGASIEQWPCEGSDACTKMLCGECRNVCARCGQSTCSEHLAALDGEVMCEVCRESLKCQHTDCYVEQWDNGKESETGYHDAGTRIVCRICGQEVG
jgi:hypothetical protein